MKTILDCKKDFLCVLTESEISHGPRGAVLVKEWHPIHKAEEPEVRTLLGRPVTEINSDEGIYIGDVRIAVEIEVAAILGRSKDRVGERGGSRREQEWQEPRSRAKRAEATDAARCAGWLAQHCGTPW